MPRYLTDEAYCQWEGEICPNCGCTMIEGDSVEIAGKAATQERKCTECGATHIAEYHLVGYVDLALAIPEEALA